MTQNQSDILKKLKEWVTARIDELMPDENIQSSPIPNLEQELDEAALFVLRTVPKELVYPAAINVANINLLLTNTGRGIIVCPNDFVRFLRVTMTHWRRPVDSLLNVDSMKYRKMDSKNLGATSDNPAAALAPGIGLPNGAAYSIELAPVIKGAKASLVYVPRLKCYDVPEVLYDPLVWFTAYRILIVLRQGDVANAAFTQMQLAVTRQFTGLTGEEMPSIIQPPRQ